MKKQFVILLAIVSALMAALFLASCGASGGSSASSAATSEAAQSEEGEATKVDAAEGDADSEGAAEEGDQEAGEAASQASVGAVEFIGLPAFQPSDHEGRTYEQCPTCHDGSTAPAIPDDHFIGGQLDGARLQCVTCHVVEPA